MACGPAGAKRGETALENTRMGSGEQLRVDVVGTPTVLPSLVLWEAAPAPPRPCLESGLVCAAGKVASAGCQVFDANLMQNCVF